MAQKSANLYVRIEPDVKEQAERILSALGIPASNAINMFYKQIIADRALPFKPSLKKELDYNLFNEETKSAVEEGRKLAHDYKAKGYHSVSDMFEDILNNED